MFTVTVTMPINTARPDYTRTVWVTPKPYLRLFLDLVLYMFATAISRGGV